jgi:hypothetical protein
VVLETHSAKNSGIHPATATSGFVKLTLPKNSGIYPTTAATSGFGSNLTLP